jgi:hypothetical protein
VLVYFLRYHAHWYCSIHLHWTVCNGFHVITIITWNRTLLKKIVVAQLIKIFSVSVCTSIYVYLNARHCSILKPLAALEDFIVFIRCEGFKSYNIYLYS